MCLKLLSNEVYTTGTSAGKRKQKLVMLAPKNDQYCSWAHVEPIMQRVLGEVNTGQEVVTADTSLIDFIEKQYLPWIESNKSAATAYETGLGELMEGPRRHCKVGMQTTQVTVVLTKHAKDGKESRTLSHIKSFLSSVYQFAIASGDRAEEYRT